MLPSPTRRHALTFGAFALPAWATGALTHRPKAEARLSQIGPAPDFTLTDHDGKLVSLKDRRGEVVAVTFIYASCVDTCPLHDALAEL
jgi:protein SCO1/2